MQQEEWQHDHVHNLTHWGRVTHICVSNLTTIGSVNGLSPGRRQAITWTNAGILLIGPIGTNFSEILIEIPTFSFQKMRLKVSSAKWRPFRLGLNVSSMARFHLNIQAFMANPTRPYWYWYRIFPIKISKWSHLKQYWGCLESAIGKSVYVFQY